jgi:type II secretory pathway predicted ATPase ExeA
VKAQVRTSLTARTAGKLDEAHLLSYEQLETIRMLTNHAMDADSPLACLLIGQPTLRRQMRLAVLAALVISSLN